MLERHKNMIWGLLACDSSGLIEPLCIMRIQLGYSTNRGEIALRKSDNSMRVIGRALPIASSPQGERTKHLSREPGRPRSGPSLRLRPHGTASALRAPDASRTLSDSVRTHAAQALGVADKQAPSAILV